MKNKGFFDRLQFALNGIRSTWQSERSFRTQVVLGVLANTLLLFLRPGYLWAAVFILITALVLAAELLNTSLERLIDHLHPETHPMIGLAKDCAAGAVLILSIASVAIFCIFALEFLWP